MNPDNLTTNPDKYIASKVQTNVLHKNSLFGHGDSFL